MFNLMFVYGPGRRVRIYIILHYNCSRSSYVKQFQGFLRDSRICYVLLHDSKHDENACGQIKD